MLPNSYLANYECELSDPFYAKPLISACSFIQNTLKLSTDSVVALSDQGLQCSVCMEDFKEDESVRRLHCEHCYHNDCIIPWLELVSMSYYTIILCKHYSLVSLIHVDVTSSWYA